MHDRHSGDLMKIIRMFCTTSMLLIGTMIASTIADSTPVFIAGLPIMFISCVVSCLADAWLHFLCSSPQIAHLVFVVYIRTWWRPKRIAGECSTAPCSVLPLIFLTLVGVVMRQCSPGKTMEAPLVASGMFLSTA